MHVLGVLGLDPLGPPCFLYVFKCSKHPAVPIYLWSLNPGIRHALVAWCPHSSVALVALWHYFPDVSQLIFERISASIFNGLCMEFVFQRSCHRLPLCVLICCFIAGYPFGSPLLRFGWLWSLFWWLAVPFPHYFNCFGGTIMLVCSIWDCL